MIYDYMWDRKTLDAHIDSMQDRLRPRHTLDPYLPFITRVPDKVPELPHFIQSRFMGLEIAHEVMVKWYEVQPDRSDSGSYPDIDGDGPVEYITIASTERVVCQDIWDVELIPADVSRRLYVCLYDCITDIDAEGETLVKALMSIKKKRNFDLSIELVQSEVRLNLWVPWIELLRPVLQAYEREGGHLRFKWGHPFNRYDNIEFDLTEVLRDTSGSEQWRQDAREYLDSLDDYILKEYHEVSAYLTSR
jgi:hypothetical protein